MEANLIVLGVLGDKKVAQYLRDCLAGWNVPAVISYAPGRGPVITLAAGVCKDVQELFEHWEGRLATLFNVHA